MWYDDAIKEFADINYEINKRYCQKNQYKLIKSSKKKLDKHPAWEKLPLILQYINNYDYIIMCDADAFFYYDSPKIENIINKNKNKDFILSGDQLKYKCPFESNFNIPDINCGLMIIKNTTFSKKFIYNWCYGKNINMNSLLWEQGVMYTLYKNNFMDIQNKSIIIPYNILQNFFKEEDQFFYSKQYGLKNKPFVYHLAGQSKDIRIKVSSNYYNYLKNNDFFYVISIQDKLTYSDIVKKYQIKDNYFPIIFNENNLNELQKLEIYHNYIKNLDESIEKIMILNDIKLITLSLINIQNFNKVFYLTQNDFNIIGNKKEVLEVIECLHDILKYQNKIFNKNFKLINTEKYIDSIKFVNLFNLKKEYFKFCNNGMNLINENNQPVNLNVEWIEQILVEKYIKPNDKVLELGARYGSVSITTNKILKDKKSHYVVEPDKKVWNCLERNMKVNNTEFNIIKGVIGKSKLEIKGQGYATHTIVSDNSNIDNYELPNVEFNVLIADCEGYLEIFYNENFDFFKNLRMVIFETDRPNACDYDKIIKGLLELGFSQCQKIPEPTVIGMYHYVFIKERYLIFDTRKEMIKYYSDKIDKPKILELGIFKGEFLDYIVENLDYSKVEGVDLFYGNQGSGDQDGNNFEYVDLEKQYVLLNNKYLDNENVNVYKSYTTTHLSNKPNNFYDIIYIDADHSYEGVKKDILLAHQKIKPGGYIMGHDYEMNMDKAKNPYYFGVRQAVCEYCENYNQEIIAKGMDGCVSFCIKVNK